MKTTGVLQMIDTLLAGGMERVALNLANHLPPDRYRAHLCATRQGGPLASLIAPHVAYFQLNRKGPLDFHALKRLLRYTRRHQVQILHPHGASLFLAAATSLFNPSLRVVWHDHFGCYAIQSRPAWIYRLAARRLRAVISVNQPLADWASRKLRLPKERVWYIPNFVALPQTVGPVPELPGDPNSRIICVANFRPQKDHPNLLRAMELVLRERPSAHLLLLGHAGDRRYFNQLQSDMNCPPLAGHVTWLGSRTDVAAILKGCAVGVLSSASEGLPLVLIEYGMARLPAVATHVGQCPELLDNGDAGLLVPPAAPEPLAQAILALLRSPEKRAELGERLSQRVQALYSPARVLKRICDVYDTVLN